MHGGVDEDGNGLRDLYGQLPLLAGRRSRTAQKDEGPCREDRLAVAALAENAIYRGSVIVTGLNGNGRFANSYHVQEQEQRYLIGYVDMDSCELVEKMGD